MTPTTAGWELGRLAFDAFENTMTGDITHCVWYRDRTIYYHDTKIYPDYTCTDCVYDYQCPFAWDTYNTGGDCLAEK